MHTHNLVASNMVAKQPVDVRPAISRKSNQRDRKRPRDEREKSAKTVSSSDAKKARQDEE